MKNNTQNEKIARITDATMVVGIDIGSETHYARAFTNRGIELSSKPFAFPNNEEGFAAFQTWAENLMVKNGMTRIMVGMEPTGHYWFNLGAFLLDSGVEIVHVNPYHVKQSKELDDNSPSKTTAKIQRSLPVLSTEAGISFHICLKKTSQKYGIFPICMTRCRSS